MPQCRRKIILLSDLPPTLKPTLELLPPKWDTSGVLEIKPDLDGQSIWISYPLKKIHPGKLVSVGLAEGQIGITFKGKLESTPVAMGRPNARSRWTPVFTVRNGRIASAKAIWLNK